MLVVANWKCNPQTLKEAKQLFNSVKNLPRSDLGKVEVVICPPFVYLSSLNLQDSGLKLGAQDCFWEQKGPFTGKISVLMLKDLGVEYVILGHSEVRALGETDSQINRKLKTALDRGLKPILCVGEKEKTSKTTPIIEQLRAAVSGIRKEKLQNILIGYEPVWAIGSGNPCPVSRAKMVKIAIDRALKEFFGSEIKDQIPVLYGGSVDSEIAKRYIVEGQMQGLLVGGASLEPKEFTKIVKSVIIK